MVAIEKHVHAADAARPSLGVRGEVRVERPRVDARGAARVRTASPLWLCDAEGSVRGWALEISATGLRAGGVGTRLPVGAHVLAKLALPGGAPAVLLRAEVVRYAPVLATDGVACPELCLRFLPSDEEGPAQGLERKRLQAHLRREARAGVR